MGNMEDQEVAKHKTSKWIFFLLWVLAILGSWSILPYLYHMGMGLQEAPVARVFTIITLQTMVLYGVVCWLSSMLLPRTDIRPFSTKDPLKSIVRPGLIAGAFVGMVIFVSNITIFKSSTLAQMHPPMWTGILASFYGAFNEEILLRGFFFTLIYFLFQKVSHKAEERRTTYLWMVNIIVAIVFGVGHMPTGMQIVGSNWLEVSRILLLNGVAGLTFGYLYWSRSLWTAMLAHFVTDILVHGFLAV